MNLFSRIKTGEIIVKREWLGGLTTFLSMAYILILNAKLFSDPFGDGSNPYGISFGAMYIATALASVVGTILMGIIARFPIAVASSIGMNNFVIYTVCVLMGFTYENAMAIVLISSGVFLIVCLSPAKNIIVKSIPSSVLEAIGPAIGLYVALFGLISAGVVTPSESNGVSLGSFNLINGDFAGVMPMIVALVGFFLICILYTKKVKGAILIGILVTLGLYYAFGFAIDGFYDNFFDGIEYGSVIDEYKSFGSETFLRVFQGGFDFSKYIEANGTGKFVFTLIMLVAAFFLENLYNTMGVVTGTFKRFDMVKEEEQEKSLEKTIKAGAISTAVGALFGASVNTATVESVTGIASGAKGGVSAGLTAFIMLASTLFAPFAALIPNCVTSCALIFIGVLLISNLTKINWKDVTVGIPAFMTIALIPFSMNITAGMAFGMATHVVLKTLTGRIKEINPGTWVITVFFVMMILFTH